MPDQIPPVLSHVVNRFLCVSCGLCTAVCPQQALAMTIKKDYACPEKTTQACISCGLCMETCPAWEVDFPSLAKQKQLPAGPLPYGTILETYTYKAKDKTLLANATSGGAVTSLITLLLSSGLYDTAFTFKTLKTGSVNNLEETSIEELSSAQGSKYTLPTMTRLIRFLIKNPRAKVIVVSTPCHLHGLLKYCALKHIDTDRFLLIGLLCDVSLNYGVYTYFQKKYSKKAPFTSFSFRNKSLTGWPGHPVALNAKNQSFSFPAYERRRLKRTCKLPRCLYCFDKLNLFSDISFGDCYIPDKTDPEGKSVVIVRTKKAQVLLEKMRFTETGETEPLTQEEVINSQNLDQKRDNYSNSLLLSHKIHHDLYPGISISDSPEPGQIKRHYLFQARLLRWAHHIAYNPFLIDIYWRIRTRLRVFISSPSPRSPKKYVLIFGASFYNKGAISMLKTTIQMINDKYPQYEPRVVSHFYAPSPASLLFEGTPIVKINFRKIFFRKNLLLKILLWISEKRIFLSSTDADWNKLLNETAFCLDISGFALSSDVSVSSSIRYLARIRKMNHHHIPYIILPQSIGPFHYPFLWKVILKPVIKNILKKVRRINLREKLGFDLLQKMGMQNITLSPDLVFFNSSGQSQKASPRPAKATRSLLLVPNIHLLDFMSQSELLQIYALIINQARQKGQEIFLLYHSQEDRDLCRHIASLHPSINFIDRDLSVDELNEIIHSFDMAVASRYHAIVHAYKNNVPCMIIGWADKYVELAKLFQQSQYCVDARKNVPINDYERCFELLRHSISEAKITISRTMESLRGKELF